MKIKNKWTDSYPSVFHLNGKTKFNRLGRRMWNELNHEVHNSVGLSHEKLREDVSLCFLSWGYSELSMLEKSLAMFGLTYSNIADAGVLTKEMSNEEILSTKIELLGRWLEKNNPKYIIGWDAGDVFFLNHPNRVVEVFENEFDCDMLFNGELEVYPMTAKYVYNDLKKIKEYNNGSKVFKYLNSGLFIVKSEFYREIYEELMNTPLLPGDPADQGIFQQLYLKYFPRIQVDVDCKIFQSTCMRKWARGRDHECLGVVE